ncbi:DUF222 domain-containing protein, partial [Paenarthrobacter sp. YAF11_1]|uniref:DUF222 domain-containing protein n=1 Tax=Paenarthrobacter sp. YAF11_1 TaxID=3233074 RepID=UPI003F989753
MEDQGQLTALKGEWSPAVAALSAVRSRRFLRMPDLLRGGFKDSTAPVTITIPFHGAGLLKGKSKSARASSLNGPAPADVPAQNTGSIPEPRRDPRTGHDPRPAQPDKRSDTLRPDPSAAGGRDLKALLTHSAALLDTARLSAAGESSLFGFVEAADFAGRVEDVSRVLEYLQIVAARAVERARTEALQAGPGSSAAAPEWRTGWTAPQLGTDTAAASQGEAPQCRTGTTTAAATDGEARPTPSVGGDDSVHGDSSDHGNGSAPGTESASWASAAKASVLDDGYRNAAEFLRARLRIGIGEAKRRLALAPEVLPQTGIAGQEIPARRDILAQAVGSALVPSRSATIISTALDKVRNLTDEDTLGRMEHALTTTAIETDPDFVTKMAKRWTDLIDHDGPEPSEEVLRQLQGVFLRRRRRHGLHHLEIFATKSSP